MVRILTSYVDLRVRMFGQVFSQTTSIGRGLAAVNIRREVTAGTMYVPIIKQNVMEHFFSEIDR